MIPQERVSVISLTGCLISEKRRFCDKYYQGGFYRFLNTHGHFFQMRYFYLELCQLKCANFSPPPEKKYCLDKSMTFQILIVNYKSLYAKLPMCRSLKEQFWQIVTLAQFREAFRYSNRMPLTSVRTLLSILTRSLSMKSLLSWSENLKVKKSFSDLMVKSFSPKLRSADWTKSFVPSFAILKFFSTFTLTQFFVFASF